MTDDVLHEHPHPGNPWHPPTVDDFVAEAAAADVTFNPSGLAPGMYPLGRTRRPWWKFWRR